MYWFQGKRWTGDLIRCLPDVFSYDWFLPVILPLCFCLRNQFKHLDGAAIKVLIKEAQTIKQNEAPLITFLYGNLNLGFGSLLYTEKKMYEHNLSKYLLCGKTFFLFYYFSFLLFFLFLSFSFFLSFCCVPVKVHIMCKLISASYTLLPATVCSRTGRLEWCIKGWMHIIN